jgi:subtilisin family serine protease
VSFPVARIACQSWLLVVATFSSVAAGGPEERALPNDPLLAEQWYLFSPGDERESPGSISAVEEWRRVRPADPIVVAVLDSGVNWKHPDLEANILLVGGTTRDGNLSRHMNFGKRVQIAAPCVDMVFPSFDGYTRFKRPGTSQSASIVAGAAATLLSQQPDLTPVQVIGRLQKASVHLPAMEGGIGGGRLGMAELFSP